jgi:hypothetical protein
LKEEQMIDAVLIKTPERIEALGIVYVMALLVYGILEYRVRSKMESEKEPLILMGKRKLFKPTGKALLEQLHDIRVIVIEQNGKRMRFLPDNIKDHTKRIVELCGYSIDILCVKTSRKTKCLRASGYWRHKPLSKQLENRKDLSAVLDSSQNEKF